MLYAALQAHGAPIGIVSDGGSVFKANQVLRIYRELGIERYQVEPGEPWQNYIETQFKVMWRMADQDNAKATAWGELRAAHDRFFLNYNHQSHLAHQRRHDGKRSPAEVLGWVAAPSVRQAADTECHRCPIAAAGLATHRRHTSVIDMT